MWTVQLGIVKEIRVVEFAVLHVREGAMVRWCDVRLAFGKAACALGVVV